MNAFRLRSIFLAGICAWAYAVPASAQGCIIPAPSDHETHLLWGGETRHVFTSEDGEVIHTAEDGGRIRRSTDGGDTWTFAETPVDVTQSLLDIWFTADGHTGYACGRGGRILISTDDGETWDHIDPNYPIHYDSNSEPATLWRIRFLSSTVGIVCGLGVFEGTGNGGQGPFSSWNHIKIFPDSSLTTAAQIPTSQFELYCLDVVGTVGGGFVGIAGAEWDDGTSDHGVVLYTDSTVGATSAGRKWWIVLDDSLDTISTGSMVEPWDIEFERGSTSLTSSVAYVTGGPGGNSANRFYRSTDSGETWSLQGSIPVTMYGVAAMPSGYAMQVGYSGNVWTRDPSNGSWAQHTIPAVGGVGGDVTAPLADVHGSDSEDYVLVGAWGVQRRTVDYGDNFTFMNPTYSVTHGEAPWRLWDVHFWPTDPDVGFVCGQRQLIAKTIDGGCTWEATNAGFDEAGFAGANLYDVEFSDESRGVAVGDIRPPASGSLPELWWTDDGGDSWNEAEANLISGDRFIVRSVTYAGDGNWWAVGVQDNTSTDDEPLVLYSNDDGENWNRMSAPSQSGLDLLDVDFVNLDEGIAVGVASGVGKAWEAEFDGTSVHWYEISLTGVGGALNGVELIGSDLATARGYTVGDGGVIQEWDGSEFDPVSPECALTVDYLAVAMAPDSDEVLVGARYDADEANAAQDGYLVRFNGTEWECVRANSGYDMSSIQLLSTELGHVIGNVSFESASFDHGKVADSAIFQYDRD